MSARHKADLPRLQVVGDRGLKLEIVPRPAVPRRGRKAAGWIGGMQVVAEVERAPAGMAVRLPLPEKVPYDRVRWGIYAAARLRGMAVSIAREDGLVHVWRLDGTRWR